MPPAVMRFTVANMLVLACVASCGGDGSRGNGDETEVGSASEATNGDASTSSTTQQTDSSSADATDDPTSAQTEPADDSADTAGPSSGPIELYRGPVADAVIPGWDADDPRPLVMMGRQGADWVATLAQIGPDGALSQNVAEEIVVWGWELAPPLLHDGPVGGSLPAWSAETPHALVMLGRSPSTDVWWSTLASIGPGGELGDNVSDRMIVWGWPTATPDAPTVVYAGPLDASASIRGWNPNHPEPLVMLGRFTGADTWQSTLARIQADGSLTDNLADELQVWGW